MGAGTTKLPFKVEADGGEGEVLGNLEGEALVKQLHRLETVADC